MNYETDDIMEEIEFPWLVFKLNDNLYTINSKFITSIVIIPEEITFVPNLSEYMAGLIHLRGNVVPLIDLKKLFKMQLNKSDEKEMVIVLERDNSFAGLIVDEVLSVGDITVFDESEEVKNMYKDGFIKGVAKSGKSEDVLLVVDEEKIMNKA